MNHAGISSGCTTCHAVGKRGTPFFGVTPLPQGSGHIPTSADCVTCHASTTEFGPGTAMQHTGITSGCATCHDTAKSFTGVPDQDQTGESPSDDGEVRNLPRVANFTSFSGTAMHHTGISSGCTTCHAAGATGTAFVG